MSLYERGEWRKGWFVVRHDVEFRDIDAYGHVNNAVYLSYFEKARTLLWFDLTGKSGARDLDFIVARAEVDFRKQLELEAIEICIRVGEIGRTSFETLYELRKNNGNDVAAGGKVVVVLFDWARQSKMAIDDDLRRTLTACSQRGF